LAPAAVAVWGSAIALSATHFSSRSRSRAVCQRSSGSFARHAATIRSSAAGTDGWNRDTGGGSSLRNRAKQPRARLAFKRRPAGQHLEQHGAERENVSARIGLESFDLLWRHVLERAKNRALRSHAGRRRRCHAAGERYGRRRDLRQPGIEQLGDRRT
jgi:hypothetical protein